MSKLTYPAVAVMAFMALTVASMIEAKPGSVSDNAIRVDLEREGSAPKAAAQTYPDEYMDQIKSIAFNAREVRLVGPDRKEVEMKSDVPTKIQIALDNLSREAKDVWGKVNNQLDTLGKEATVVWGQMNTKLDKGWGNFKSMIDDALAPKKTDKLQYTIET